MKGRNAKRPGNLRLVEPTRQSDLPAIFADQSAREEFERLTELLLDKVVEMLDVADGDPDTEPNGDELEEGDGL